MKIQLDYEPQTGNITNKNGTIVGTWLGLESEQVLSDAESRESRASKISVAELKELKEAGYTSYEIAELRASGII